MVKYSLILVFCTAIHAAAQPPVVLRPLHTSAPIVLDGSLADTAWQQAITSDNLVQCLPLIGARPSERTLVKILYTDNYLFVGIHAYDSAPHKIVATGLERDVFYSSDDNVSLAIDTYHDKRQGILFSTNPLSARFDEEVLDNGNSFNAAYNTFWDVRSAIHHDGYVVEFRIPFSSLRFQMADTVVMGFKVIRYIKHRNEIDIFPASDASVANAAWRINNSASIAFTGLSRQKPFYIAPYAKAIYQEQKHWNSDAGYLETQRQFMPRSNFHHGAILDKALSNLGFDIKYGLSKNFTLDLTVNTDFAQAETDNRILNFTRFAVNLPEKRNFFLESKDYLGFTTGSGMLLFNSRTIGLEKGAIVPLVGGVRLSGKADKFQVGLLDLQTGSVSALNIDPQHFTVLRVRREILDNGSFVGGLFSNRVSTRGATFQNQTVGLDILRRFLDNQWTVGANVGATNDHAAGMSVATSMANVVVNRVSSLGYNLNSSVEFAGKNFLPLTGFRPDSAYVWLTISNGYIWKWKGDEKRNLIWLTQLIDYKYRTINRTHESLFAELEAGCSFQNGVSLVAAPFTGRDYLPYSWNFAGDIVAPIGYYPYSGIRIRLNGKQTRPLSYTLTSRFTGFYSGVRLLVGTSGYYAFNKNFRFTCNWEFNAFDLPRAMSPTGVATYQSNLLACGIAFTQSIYFSAKALIQYDDISKTIGGNFRLRINPKEGTDLFIVYNPRLHTAFPDHEGPLIDQQSFIVKFTKTFNL